VSAVSTVQNRSAGESLNLEVRKRQEAKNELYNDKLTDLHCPLNTAINK
jgi:hypothetical protein